MEKEVKRQLEIMTSGASEVIPLDELEKKVRTSLERGIPLRVKMGIDPTSPDVHLGHMVVYRKMRQFQDLGHKAVLIIGDYTARIGDPTGRNRERPPLSAEEVRENSRTYTSQIFKIVDEENTEVLYQSSWFGKVSLEQTLSAASVFSVAQMLAHETFRKRLESGNRLSLHEMFYPVLQAWDSHFVHADVELGGFDQKFNILCGRDLQKSRGDEPQTALFMPLLAGTDGRKMSKSLGNHIAVLSPPGEKFGRIMSIDDNLICDFFLYGAGKTERETEEIRVRLKRENPRDIKLQLAEEIVAAYHGRSEAAEARKEFVSVFSAGGVPEDMPSIEMDSRGELLVALLKKSGVISSASEGRRLIEQGGVSIDGVKILDPECIPQTENREPIIVKAGKRRFLKIRFSLPLR